MEIVLFIYIVLFACCWPVIDLSTGFVFIMTTAKVKWGFVSLPRVLPPDINRGIEISSMLLTAKTLVGAQRVVYYFLF